MSCPACSHETATETKNANVVKCDACGGIYTTSPIYLGDSYGIVKPQWSTDEDADDHACYFDLTTLGSNGLQRRHGWFDTRTGLITQTG